MAGPSPGMTPSSKAPLHSAPVIQLSNTLGELRSNETTGDGSMCACKHAGVCLSTCGDKITLRIFYYVSVLSP